MDPSTPPTYVSNQVTLTPDDHNVTDITMTFGTAAGTTSGRWNMSLPFNATLESAISTENWGIEVIMAEQYQFTSGVSEVSIEINGTCPNSECDLFWVCPLVHCSYCPLLMTIYLKYVFYSLSLRDLDLQNLLNILH